MPASAPIRTPAYRRREPEAVVAVFLHVVGRWYLIASLNAAELTAIRFDRPNDALDRTSLTGYIYAMALIYSTYEAKARFSEVIRHVREGRTVTVSYRGEPVAEIRAIQRNQQQTIEERLDDLRQRGILVRSGASKQTLQPVARRPGALARFLAERDE